MKTLKQAMMAAYRPTSQERRAMRTLNHAFTYILPTQDEEACGVLLNAMRLMRETYDYHFAHRPGNCCRGLRAAGRTVAGIEQAL